MTVAKFKIEAQYHYYLFTDEPPTTITFELSFDESIFNEALRFQSQRLIYFLTNEDIEAAIVGEIRVRLQDHIPITNVEPVVHLHSTTRSAFKRVVPLTLRCLLESKDKAFCILKIEANYEFNIHLASSSYLEHEDGNIYIILDSFDTQPDPKHSRLVMMFTRNWVIKYTGNKEDSVTFSNGKVVKRAIQLVGTIKFPPNPSWPAFLKAYVDKEMNLPMDWFFQDKKAARYTVRSSPYNVQRIVQA